MERSDGRVRRRWRRSGRRADIDKSTGAMLFTALGARVKCRGVQACCIWKCTSLKWAKRNTGWKMADPFTRIRMITPANLVGKWKLEWETLRQPPRGLGRLLVETVDSARKASGVLMTKPPVGQVNRDERRRPFKAFG